MKLNRLPSHHPSRAPHFNHWLRDPFAGFSAVSQLLEALPELHAPLSTGRIPADVFEGDDAYHVHLEIPGVRKEDITLELLDSQLSLTAVKKHAETKTENSTTLKRTISVPKDVEQESISAKLEHGILQLTLPKSPENKPKTIEVL